MSTININDDETILPIYHNFNFKRFAIATIITTIVGGVVVSFNRSSINNDHQLRNNRALVVGDHPNPIPITECIINAVDLLQIPEEAPIAGGDVQYECDNGSNFIPIKFDAAQITALEDKVATGEAIFAKSKLDVEGEMIDEDGIIKFTPGRLISILAHEKKEVPWDRQRNLQEGTGNKYFILFRVTDSNGLVYPHSASVMSDNMFGTGGTDSVNLKTQLYACSVGKYIVIPGGKNGYDFSGLESAPGVVDITIPISLNNPRSTVRNAAITAAKEKLGNYFGLSTATHLMTYMDHALYSLEGCYHYQGKQN